MIRWPFARRSWPYLMIAAFPVVIGFCFHWVVGLLFCLPAGLFFQFFRDPERQSPELAENVILAPADGKIISITDSPHSDWEGYQRISIFMNVFNVHVNRAPVGSTLRSLYHFPGRFLPADDKRAPSENERMEFQLNTKYKPILMVLVAGLIARRIITWARPDDSLIRGQRISMIKFGSRVDLHVPADGKFLVQPGTRVKAGLTPLYELKEAQTDSDNEVQN